MNNMSSNTNNVELRIEAIEMRNKRVELDKAWETSWTRKCGIMLLTYAVVVLFFYSAGLGNPFVNAIVPTMGFFLSTLSLGWMKALWVRGR